MDCIKIPLLSILSFVFQHPHCAQCTLAAIMEILGTVDENLLKSVDALTGGAALSTKGT